MAVAVLLAVGLVVLTAGADLAEPWYIADPVPKTTISEADLPAACGVRAATLRRYLPGSKRADWCSWKYETAELSGGGARELSVGFAATHPARLFGGGTVNVQLAGLMAMNGLRPIDARSAPRALTGLGDEARYQYASPAGLDLVRGYFGAGLRFRVGTSVITVTYTAVDQLRYRVPEKEARPVVLAVAADVARALHVPANPAFAPRTEGPPPPAAHPARPCDLLPDDLAALIVPKSERTAVAGIGPLEQYADDPLVPAYGEAAEKCSWNWVADLNSGSPQNHLSVRVLTETDRRPGIAARQATRQFLAHYDAVRARNLKGFHAVGGLGDQAYLSYRPSMGAGAQTGCDVAFRSRNRVVVISYSAFDGSEHSPADEIDSAYTVALRVQEALR